MNPLRALYRLSVALLKAIKKFIRSWPPWIRYPLTILTFLPTAGFWRIVCWLFPKKREWWHPITPHVILGAVPFTRAEIRHLYHAHNVRGIVNMCREWNWHESYYKHLGVRQAYLPTIDFDAPSLENLLEGARFIAEHESRGEAVYVHCKAGRGRSTCAVIAYLVLYKGMSPSEAQAHIQARRSHVSKKWHLPVFVEIERIAIERRAAGGGQHGHGHGHGGVHARHAHHGHGHAAASGELPPASGSMPAADAQQGTEGSTTVVTTMPGDSSAGTDDAGTARPGSKAVLVPRLDVESAPLFAGACQVGQAHAEDKSEENEREDQVLLPGAVLHSGRSMGSRAGSRSGRSMGSARSAASISPESELGRPAGHSTAIAPRMAGQASSRPSSRNSNTRGGESGREPDEPSSALSASGAVDKGRGHGQGDAKQRQGSARARAGSASGRDR